MTSARIWTFLLAAVVVIDVGARFLAAFDFDAVMLFEGPLFALTAALFAWRIRRDGSAPAWPRRVRLLLVAFFALGAIRPLLYTAGLDLYLANLLTLVATLMLAAVWWFRRYRRPPPPASA